MAARDFEAIIIGAGQAGPSLAGRLIAAGRFSALFEARDDKRRPRAEKSETQGFIKIVADADTRPIQ